MMAIRGYAAYRIRGRYYSVYSHWDSYPSGLGRSLLNDIPTDPEEFQAWKRGQITHYLGEETRVVSLAHYDPYQSNENSHFWGYARFPSRRGPQLDHLMDWMYIIDLDQNVFSVCTRNSNHDFVTRYFRLDNIPRWLFDDQGPRIIKRGNESNIHPIMAASEESMPGAFWSTSQIVCPVPDPELLSLYANFSPQHVRPFYPMAHNATERRLQLLLIQQFVEHFILSFQDACSARNRSPFVFRQLAYAILCLTSSRTKFHATNTPHKVRRDCPPLRIKTPTWEPPSTDNYWLDGVLIVLSEHMNHTEILHAAIAMAVQLACAVGGSFDTVAVIFSVRCIAIANICRKPCGHVVVSHSHTLPLLSFDDTVDSFGKDAMEAVRNIKYSTPGIQTLLDLFYSARSVSPPPISRPGNLPTEICQHLFRSADPDVRCLLEQSCRLFRDIANEYPRVGSWSLLQCYGEGGFVAVQRASEAKRVLALEVLVVDADWLDGGRWGVKELGAYEVVLCNGGEKLMLNMPLVVVRNVTGTEGKDVRGGE